MWAWFRTSQRQGIERQALALTPSPGISLAGFWTITEHTDKGPVSSGARLDQHGVTVEGWMQCKFAAAHPLSIRGILLGRQLTATWSRPHPGEIGSGVLQLTVSDDGQSLEGTGTWFSPGAGPTTHALRWTRTAS